mmetsp:Transcript_35583/g.70352  ORF Transcript_35583/g.70352 Transcript_35583/m.70352 type:complete len:205 (-) Transcript_35583:384-998(-)
MSIALVVRVVDEGANCVVAALAILCVYCWDCHFAALPTIRSVPILLKVRKSRILHQVLIVGFAAIDWNCAQNLVRFYSHGYIHLLLRTIIFAIRIPCTNPHVDALCLHNVGIAPIRAQVLETKIGIGQLVRPQARLSPTVHLLPNMRVIRRTIEFALEVFHEATNAFLIILIITIVPRLHFGLLGMKHAKLARNLRVRGEVKAP